MLFSIEDDVLQRFSGFRVGLIVARGVDNAGIRPDLLDQLRQEETRIRRDFSLPDFGAHPRVSCWRQAYTAFGGEPKKNRSSVENLYKMVLDGHDVRTVNPLVDAYNVVSLRHMLPVGGEDLDRMQGDLALRFAGANEVPVVLLGEREARAPKTGEVIYADAVGAICRRWNWREADRTKLTSSTQNAVLMVEGLPPASRADVEAATDELAALVRVHGGGTVRTFVLDASHPSGLI